MDAINEREYINIQLGEFLRPCLDIMDRSQDGVYHVVESPKMKEYYISGISNIYDKIVEMAYNLSGNNKSDFFIGLNNDFQSPYRACFSTLIGSLRDTITEFYNSKSNAPEWLKNCVSIIMEMLNNLDDDVGSDYSNCYDRIKSSMFLVYKMSHNMA